VGSFWGQRLLKKVSLPLLHKFIGWMILALSVALAAGWI
jgi:uncharacterized membrane protein YfcA